jgi:hypothetical protein
MQPEILTAFQYLAAWQKHAEQDWYSLPARPGLGCYGTGYNDWGVQTNQKYLAAMAALATAPEPVVPPDRRELARERALAALRFSLATHKSGDLACLDGAKWGHTWISPLGLERMMFALPLLDSALKDADRADLKRVLASESDWMLNDYRKGNQSGVFGDRWNHSGKNVPESNIWTGAILWRTAVMQPDHPSAARWQERAHEFLMNGVSIAADALDERLVAGRPVRQWFRGDNFFPNYALDHHGYLNVGYMVICLSNAAMLHFDLKLAGLPAPESLHHHQADLWERVRRFLFSDGRLLRLGGDTRVRYTYCQEYLLPTLLYAADHLGDAGALDLIPPILEWIGKEAAFNGDGSFYGKRLTGLAARSPYYYTRLESDRACCLAQLTAYLPACRPTTRSRPVVPEGLWLEDEYGAMLHRSPTRLASFAWRAHGLTQGFCLAPDDSHLAEWDRNLSSCVRFSGEDEKAPQNHRALLWHRQQAIEGGFLTVGCVEEGRNLALADGWRRQEAAARHWLAFVALPDNRTVVGLEFCRAAPELRACLASIRGLHCNVPNDLYNGFGRKLTGPGFSRDLAPADHDETIVLPSNRACVDNRLAVCGIYGADRLVVDRSATRRGGQYQTLFVDELCYGHRNGPVMLEPGATILDLGWAVASSTGTAELTSMTAQPLADLPEGVRAVRVCNGGETFLITAGWGCSPGLAASLPGKLLAPVLAGADGWVALLRVC